MVSNNKILKLKGKTIVFVDWANVYNWQKSLKWKIDPKKLFNYFSFYKEIQKINFYFGTDKHPASKDFIKEMRTIGYNIITKPVKYLPVQDNGKIIWTRKCDFDTEMSLDCMDEINNFDTFIFLSGDGDLAPVYKRVINSNKKLIVVFASDHLGKEIRMLKKGIYLCNVKKISPNRRLGA